MDATSNQRIPKKLMELASTVERRLKGYTAEEAIRLRRDLVTEWRAAYPKAAQEKSGAFHPLIPMAGWSKGETGDADECWHNDVYTVMVRRHRKDPVFHTDGGMIQLGISAHHGTACHDWRDFMEIKNQLAGQECEAFELYPSQWRRLDPSNYYTLWCFPGVRRINVGEDEHRVFRSDEALSPQRALPEESQ